MTAENKAVLFADILGFAHLTESNPLDIERCSAGDRPIWCEFGEIFASPRNELARTFSNFHRTLRGAINLARLNHTFTAITFSDSVFVATDSVNDAILFGIHLVHSLLTQKIPIRMGIGYGTFAALRFRSDISPDSGDHAAQFLGTAVVRAHAAETCGIKGLRILLHPSVISLINDDNHKSLSTRENSHAIRYIECSEKDQLNSTSIRHEVDYWHLPPTQEKKAWQGLQDMWDESPASASEHYEATAEAINRMRISQGHKPLNKLRRRTLP